MRFAHLLGGSLAAAVILAGCSDTSEPTGPATSGDARLIGPQQTTVEIDAIYSGDPARPSGTIVLTDEWVYVEILDVEAHIPTPNVSADDVRIGEDWETGVPAESFEILDINQDGNRDIRVRWDLEELEDAGHLPEGTVTIQVFGQDPNTGEEFEGEMEVEVIGDPGIVPCEWDNGGMVTHPGGGTGVIAGEDVSMSSPAPHNTAGSNVRLQPGGPHFRIADDFEVTEECVLRYVVTHGYETGAATPNWTQANLNIRDGSVQGAIVASATTSEWEFSGVYRTFNGVLNNADRPVHEIWFEFSDVVLQPGTYWIDWQVEGGVSGWANYVMEPNPDNPNAPFTVFDNGQQMTVGGVWQPMLDPPGAESPFRVHGPGAQRADRGAPVPSRGWFAPAGYGAQVLDAATPR